MMKIMANRQRGVSMSSFLMVIVILVFVAIGGMKLIPAYMENRKIKNIFDVVAHDPDMQKASLKDIRNSYARRASVEAITVINENEVHIDNDNGISLSASYTVKIPLASNASLVLEFNPSNSK